MRAVLTVLGLVAATAAARDVLPQRTLGTIQPPSDTVGATEVAGGYVAYGPYNAWSESPAMDIKPVRTHRQTEHVHLKLAV